MNRIILSYVYIVFLVNSFLLYCMEQNTVQEFLSEVPETRAKNFIEGISYNKAAKNKHKYYQFAKFGISWSDTGDERTKQSFLRLPDSPTGPRQTLGIDDNREIVTNTECYPYRCFGQVESYQGKRKHGGSAILIGSHHALTAAHNIYELEDDRWRTNISVNFGRNGQNGIATCSVVRAYIPEGYIKNRNSDFDIALLVLENPVGLSLGWLGCIFAVDDTMFREKDINVTGYPGDLGWKHLYTMANKFHELKDERIFYKIFTSGGSSGSPIWMHSETNHGKQQPVVIGIHTHGEGEKGSGNSGVRLTEKKFKQLMGWINETEQFEIKPSDLQMKQQFTNNDLLLMGKAAYYGEDYSKAVNCFERIAQQPEDSFEKAYACTYLAKMHFFGKGVAKKKGSFVKYCKEVLRQAHNNSELSELAAVVIELRSSESVDDPVSNAEPKKTRIIIAAEHNQLELVIVLLEKGSKISTDGRDFDTVLHVAARRGHLKLVEFLLNTEDTLDPNLFNGNDITPLCEALKKGHLDSAQLLVLYGANINLPVKLKSLSLLYPKFSTILHYVIEHYSGVPEKFFPVIQYLISKGLTLNTKDNRGVTPFFLAIKCCTRDTVYQLIDLGAQVNLTDTAHYRSALHYAAKNKNRHNQAHLIAELLLSCGAEVNLQTIEGETPLMIAVKKDCLPIARLLLAKGGRIMLGDDKDVTPLHEASNSSMAKLLLDAGADVNAQSKERKTPLHFAVDKGSIEVVKVLYENGANVNACTASGKTPLHLAALKGDAKMVGCLLSFKADPCIKDIEQHTAFIAVIKQLAERAKQHQERTTKQNRVIYHDDKAIEIAKLLSFTSSSEAINALLCKAIKNNWEAVVDLILKLNFKPEDLTLVIALNSLQYSGELLILGATNLNSTYILQSLLEKGGNPNAYDKSTGSTLLHIACSRRSKDLLELVKLLVDAGADPFKANYSNNTPYQMEKAETILNIFDNVYNKLGVKEKIKILFSEHPKTFLAAFIGVNSICLAVYYMHTFQLL